MSRTDPPPVEWRYTIDTELSTIKDPLAVGVDRVFLSCADGTVRAVDHDTGEESWCFQTDHHINSGLTVCDGTVFAGSNDNRLYALFAPSGVPKWEFETVGGREATPTDIVMAGLRTRDEPGITRTYEAFAPEGKVQSTPTVVDGRVYFGADDGYVYALGADDGDSRWRVETGDWNWARPTVANGTVFVGSTDGSLHAIDAETGERAWERDLGDVMCYASPVVDGTVLASVDDSIVALAADDGTVRWRTTFDDTVGSLSRVIDGVAYGVGEEWVGAVDVDDGTIRWRVDAEPRLDARPPVAGGTVFVGGEDGTVLALDADGGELVWSFEFEADEYVSALEVADGNVWIGNAVGQLVALERTTDSRN